ncbi:MAG: V-type ATPase 116kDa subunit family protein [Candidatus Bilamarchaeaceae archaeon]
MLKPAKMRKIRIFALSSSIENIIKRLHELGVVEIRKFKAEGLEEGRPLESFDQISEKLLKVRSLANALKLSGDGENQERSLSSLFDEAEFLVKTIGNKVDSLIAKKSNNDEEIRRIKTDIQTVEKLLPFEIDFQKISTNAISYVVGEIDRSKIEKLRAVISQVCDSFEILEGKSTKGLVPLLVVFKKGAPVEAALASVNFNTIEVPKDTTVPATTLKILKEKLENIISENKMVEKELVEISKNEGKRILNLLTELSIHADRAVIASKFAKSKTVFVIEGFIKEADYPFLVKEIEKMKEQAVLQEASIGHDEKVPTVLENPSYASPFEFVTKEYSLPNYFEFDPTMLYLITLPILYAMIVGDVVYGVLSIFIAKFFLDKFKNSYIMQNVCKLWLYSSIPTIIFGIIFNEWGGMTLAQLAAYLASWGLPDLSRQLTYAGLSRLHGFSLFLGVTLLAGFLHLALGFILGALKNWEHHRKHAYAKISWLGVEIAGTILVCSSFLGLLPQSFVLPAGIVFAISVIGLFWTEGIVGIFELPGLAGNILSYARIAAVGVVGVVLAEIINEFFLPSAANGIMALIFFPILIALHAINAFIAMFEALIQGGRLNVIEFKSKFVDGGGVLFSPFSLRSKKR